MFILEDMEVSKIKMQGLCLLLLMPLLLLPGSAHNTCQWFSKTYTTFRCEDKPCAEHCRKEGFPTGWCDPVALEPPTLMCFCRKPC
ncbi:hypothetical protein ZWY2020_029798 [Hordeum vulgare]|uniref:Knottins-like domain-containing protein n=1 Tax=Hordeum vulgare subsp. vulgare TaxID=112509 RepID=A0A8I6XWX6_HORVV|nr:hypothetical protein ZWY2020_029798 [Hordeum vulgare]